MFIDRRRHAIGLIGLTGPYESCPLYYKKTRIALELLTPTRDMLFQLILCISFALGFVQAVYSRHPDTCSFFVQLKLYIHKNGIVGEYIKNYVSFNELNNENMKKFLNRAINLNLPSDDFEVEVLGYCIPEPGWSTWRLSTDEPVNSFQMELQKVENLRRTHKLIDFPDTNSEYILDFRVTWKSPLNMTTFFVNLEELSVGKWLPILSLSSSSDRVTFFPNLEADAMRIELGGDDKIETQLNEQIRSDYICALDLLSNSNAKLVNSKSNMKVFKSSEHQTPASTWKLADESSNHSDLTRSRFFVDKFARAAYTLSELRHDDKVHYYGLVGLENQWILLNTNCVFESLISFHIKRSTSLLEVAVLQKYAENDMKNLKSKFGLSLATGRGQM